MSTQSNSPAVPPENEDPRLEARRAQVTEVFLLVASGKAKTVMEACEQVGISYRTYYRYVGNPDFMPDVAAISKQAISEAVLGAASSLPLTIENLAKIARGEKGGARDQVTAGRTLIEFTARFAGLNLLAPSDEEGKEKSGQTNVAVFMPGFITVQQPPKPEEPHEEEQWKMLPPGESGPQPD